MQLQTETVTIGDTEFVVKELSINDLLPIITQMDEDPMAGQLRMMERCVHLDGEVLGEKFGQLPGRVYRLLAPIVMRVNGMGEDEVDEEGN